MSDIKESFINKFRDLREAKLNEDFARVVKGIKRSLKGWPAQPLHGEGGKKPMDVVKRTRVRSDADIKSLASDSNKAAEHSPAGLQKNVAKQEMKRRSTNKE